MSAQEGAADNAADERHSGEENKPETKPEKWWKIRVGWKCDVVGKGVRARVISKLHGFSLRGGPPPRPTPAGPHTPTDL